MVTATPARSVALPPALDLALFRRIADLSTEGFYVVDRRGRFLYCNAQAHLQMGGYTMEELLQLTIFDISPDMTPDIFTAQVAALRGGASPRVEVRTQRKDGVIFPAAVSTALLEYRSEIYFFGVARDVTDQRAIETKRKRLAAELLLTIDAERQRVARELHDDVGQAVATIGVLLDALELSPEAVPDTAKPTLASTRETIRQITESLARIVREYHPAELLGLGLEDTLRAHAQQLAQRHGLALRITSVGVEGCLTPDHELHVYRVVQEALANTARHARARAVSIEITRTSDAAGTGDAMPAVDMSQPTERLVVTVRDDGVGFDPAATTAHGVGLAMIRERAMLLHGSCAIESRPGGGTTVRLTVPRTIERPPPDTARRAVTSARISRTPTTPEAAAPLPEMLDLEVFRQMADMASEAFMLCDNDGRFVYVNDRACRMYECSREELLARTVSDVNPDMPMPIWREWADAAQGPVPPFEVWNLRKDGVRMPVEVCSTPIDVRGTKYFFAVVRDITDRKEAEAAERGFTRRLLHTLEAERRRVARELHDEVGQAIAAVGVLLHTIENFRHTIPERHYPELVATHATIRQITESVARIVRDYHPAELLGLGLEETLRTHAQQFTQRHGLLLRLSTTAVDGLFSDEEALHVYRIVQEALANVARHGEARRVNVQLARHGTRVTLTVRDDGVGFDPDDGRGRIGLGLVTMRERAELLGGALDVRSAPGRGTEIRLAVSPHGVDTRR